MRQNNSKTGHFFLFFFITHSKPAIFHFPDRRNGPRINRFGVFFDIKMSYIRHFAAFPNFAGDNIHTAANKRRSSIINAFGYRNNIYRTFFVILAAVNIAESKGWSLTSDALGCLISDTSNITRSVLLSKKTYPFIKSVAAKR